MHLRALLLAAGLACCAGTASAHDTWFDSQPATAAGWRLALGTGNAFPVHEISIGANYVVRQGCAGPQGALPLTALSNTDTALLFQAPAEAANCWAQLDAFEVTLAPSLIHLYLREVNPPPEIRAAWAAMQSRGKPWVERYTKYARAVRAGATAAQPSGMAMDALLESTAPQHAFRILRDGQPLADFAVEFRHERARIGVWQRTDAQGRVSFTPTLAGQWLLRGIDLRVSTTRADTWDSRFVTLAFTVDQNGIKASPKARSTNQPAETAAMNAEPTANTAQRYKRVRRSA